MRTLCLMLTSLMLSLSLPVWAEHGSEHSTRHDSPAHNNPLTDEQRATFKELKHNMHANREAHRDLHQQMHELIFSEDFNKRKLNKMIRQHQDEMREQMVKNAEAMNAFYTSLNDEQRKAVMEQCEERKEAWMEKRKQCKEKNRESLKHE